MITPAIVFHRDKLGETSRVAEKLLVQCHPLVTRGWVSADVVGAIDNQRRPKRMSGPSLARTPSSRCHCSTCTPLLALPPPRHRRRRRRRCRQALVSPASGSLLLPLRSWLDIVDYPRAFFQASFLFADLQKLHRTKRQKIEFSGPFSDFGDDKCVYSYISLFIAGKHGMKKSLTQKDGSLTWHVSCLNRHSSLDRQVKNWCRFR